MSTRSLAFVLVLASFVLASVVDGASPASCSTTADCQASIPQPALASTVNCVNGACSVTYSGSCSSLSPLANYSNKDGTPVTVTLAGATVQLQNIITPRDALENTGDGYHGFYCPDCFNGCPAAGTNWWTVPGTASFKEFADGTATLSYTVFQTDAPLYQLQIDVALSGGATFSQLPGTFNNEQDKINHYVKNERGVDNQDLKKYYFYQNVAAHITGPATSQAFTVAKPIGPAGNFVSSSAGGPNPLSGLVVDMDVFMFPFETGFGASNKDSPSDGLIDGMSGWIARSNAVVHQPTSGPCTFSQPYNNHADFNLYTTRTCTAEWQTNPNPNGGGTPDGECPGEDCVVFTRSPTAPQPIVVGTEVETCVTLSFSTN